MTKEYVAYRDNLSEALEHLDEFQTKMDKFIKENPKYSYKVNIKKADTSWAVAVKVKTNEQINITTT